MNIMIIASPQMVANSQSRSVQCNLLRRVTHLIDLHFLGHRMSAPASLPVKIVPSIIRPIAYRILSKKHGLNIQTDALSVLTDAIALKFGAEWKGPKCHQFLEEIAKLWKQQDRGIFIDGPGLTQVVKELSKDKEVPRAVESFIEPLKASKFDTVSDAIAPPATDGTDLNWRDFFKFVTPDVQPKFVFDRVRKQFVPQPVAKSKLSNTLRLSTEYYNQRYYVGMDRLSRDENFKRSTFSSIAGVGTSMHATSEITLIKNVLGRDGQKFTLFGLLSKNVNGNYILEDSSDYIELNIKQARKTPGSFYSTGMLLIIEGIYSASGGSMSNDANVISGCFHVSYLQHPQAERREASLDAYGHLDFLGVHSDPLTLARSSAMVKIDRPLRKRLTSLERSLVNHKLVMLGCNIYFDNFKVMAGLKKFFSVMEEMLEDQQDQGEEGHTTIILPGSFVSTPLTLTNASLSLILSSENYKSYFDSFAEMLSGFPLVVNKCKFVLIPGPNDPWQSTFSLGRSSLDALPQTSIPRVFTTRLERLLPKGSLIFGWNPMRINYISQELVLFRDDIMNKFKRNDIIFQSDLDLENQAVKLENVGKDTDVENIMSDEVHLPTKIKMARQLVKTLLDQGDLQPFLKDLRVINTNYQHLIRIEPLPTTLMLFDSGFKSFEVTYNGCKVANIGGLIDNQNSRKLNYVEYSPASKKYNFKELFF